MSSPKGEAITVMRHALKQIRAQFSMAHERFVLFTSFNFAAPFSRGNVLPLLVGDVVEELPGGIGDALCDQRGFAPGEMPCGV